MQKVLYGPFNKIAVWLIEWFKIWILLLFSAVNPAIMAAEETIGVVQGLSVELEVYVSGYPVPTSSQITWYYPNDTRISDTDTGVGFQDGGRRLILSNVQTQQAGLYDCTVVLSLAPYMGAMTSIQLNVYGKKNNHVACK